MLIDKLRLWVQSISFLVLTYGGRIGIQLGHAVPCFACPYVTSCGGHCFLMLLQRVGILGIAAYDKLFTWLEFENLFWFLVFFLLAALFSKLWCGWLCPFGTVLDCLSVLRRKLGIAGFEFSRQTRHRLKYIKYGFLAIIFILPLCITYLSLSEDWYLAFCQICPARVIMPLFAGETRHLAIIYDSPVLLLLTVTAIIFTGITIVGSFFVDRFFCMLCPMLPLIQLVSRFSPLHFTKTAVHCRGCGNCQRVCPMERRGVTETKTDRDVMSTDCLLCTKCIEACPENNALSLSLGSKKLFSSSRAYVIKKFLHSVGEKNDQ